MANTQEATARTLSEHSRSQVRATDIAAELVVSVRVTMSAITLDALHRIMADIPPNSLEVTDRRIVDEFLHEVAKVMA